MDLSLFLQGLPCKDKIVESVWSNGDNDGDEELEEEKKEDGDI